MILGDTQAEIDAANAIGEATGMGAPDLDEETPADAEEAQPEAKKPAQSSPSKEDEEDPEDSEEDEGEDDDKDENRYSRKDGKKLDKSVPYDKHKNERTKRQVAEAKLAERDTQIITALEGLTERLDRLETSKKPAEQQVDELDAAVKEVAEEMGVDADEDLQKLIKTILKVGEKKFGNKMPDDLKDKLSLLDKLQKQDEGKDEDAHFNNEWKGLVPDLQKAYPNATEAQLAEAKELLDDLAHTQKYSLYDLADIINAPKNKGKFDTILTVVGKGKSGEPSKHIGKADDYSPSNDDEETIEDIENLTPDIMKDRDKARTSGETFKDYKIMKPVH